MGIISYVFVLGRIEPIPDLHANPGSLPTSAGAGVQR
jgi:hypothetical protein